MKKLILFMVVCLTLSSFITGCKGSPEQPEGSGTPADTGERVNPIIASMPTYDFGGREFRIMNFQGCGDTLPHEEGTTEIDQTLFRKTKYVEELLNVELKSFPAPNSINTTLPAIQQNHLGGGGDFDICFPHPTEGIVGTLTGGYCANLLDLSSLSLDQPWYNQNMVENYQTNGKLYLVTGDDSILGQGCPIILYNKDLYSQAGLTRDLYRTVNDGEWTIEAFLDTVKEYAPSQDGLDDSQKTYSMIFHKAAEYNYMYACDQPTVKRDSENKYTLAFETTKLNNIASVLYELLYESGNVAVFDTVYYAEWGTSDMLRTFASQRAIFFPNYDIGCLYSHLREMDFRIGYLPLPKYDLYQQDYCTVCSGGFYLIPSVGSPEQQNEAAIVLECLSRYSYVYMRPAFFNEILMGRLSKDQADYDMLEMLHESKYFDIGYTFSGSGTNHPARDLLTIVVRKNQSKSCTTVINSNKGLLNALVESINEIE